MAEKRKIYPNPEFSSIEDEEKFWATHSPLDEGFSGEEHREKQKRSSFFTIRLTVEELTQLRDVAAAKGMGPSTFTRTLIKEALSNKQRTVFAVGESSRLSRIIEHRFTGEKPSVYVSDDKDKFDEQHRRVGEAYCVFKLGDAPVIQAKLQQYIAAAMSAEFFNQFLTDECVKVITPGDAEFEEIARIAKEEINTVKE